MLLRWAFALMLLTPAMAGCRAARPIYLGPELCCQSDASKRPSEAKTLPAPESDDRPTGGFATQASHDQPEVVPPATADQVGEYDSSTKVLTLADLEAMAFGNNPTLAGAAARVEMASGRRLQAGLFPNPVAGYHATEIGNLDTAGQQGGFVSQRFITGGKLRLDSAIAGKEIDEAQFHLQAQEQRVMSDVRVRFYEALVTQRRVELTEELTQIGDNLVTATEKLLKGQVGTENDLLQAQIEADQSHILLDNATNENSEARRRLATVVGLTTLPATPLEGELDTESPYFDWETCYARAISDNPELDAARARVERAGIAIRRAQKEPIPDVDLSVSVRHHNVSSDDVTNIQAGIPIPVFNRNQGNIRSAQAQWIAARKELERLELDLQDRLAVAYRRYANARGQVERYQDRMIPRAKKSLDLVTAGYEKGQVEYLTLLTAQQTYLRVNLSYLDSWQELRTATSIIEGQLLTGSLTSRNP